MTHAVFLILATGVSGAALAHAPPPVPPEREIIFQTDRVAVDRDVPLGTSYEALRLGVAGNLIRVRAGFVTEIVRSADAL